ncbi:MAG: carboxypeptidase regulatory-like domain-containing protein [Pirellulaceae bacterium]|nr:carboxypeptidase regulatory-like domain-containing protein [Pirellulaceae bacterium]
MKRLLALISIVTLSVLSAQSVTAQTVNTLTANQWVQPANDGVLQGRIVIPATNGATTAVEGASVAMMSKDGQVHRSIAKTNSQGEFTIKDVQPGVYALTARADFVFAACAMHVLDSDLVAEKEFPQQAEISAANIDFTTVKTAVIRYMPPSADDNTASIDDAELSVLADRVCGQESFRVAQFQGGLKGRLHTAGAQGANLNGAQLTNVFIIKDGQEVARTITNELGEFQIAQMGAGNYSLMAVGPDGLGLIGFELVDTSELETSSAAVTADGKQLVGLFGHHKQNNCCPELCMQVAPTECYSIVHEPAPCGVCGQSPCGCGIPVAEEIIIDDGIVMDDFGTPYAGGGCCGGGGGGYGGGGFGGGFGNLAGLAAIGGLIAVTLDDDDDKVKKVKPLSPFKPHYFN